METERSRKLYRKAHHKIAQIYGEPTLTRKETERYLGELKDQIDALLESMNDIKVNVIVDTAGILSTWSTAMEVLRPKVIEHTDDLNFANIARNLAKAGMTDGVFSPSDRPGLWRYRVVDGGHYVFTRLR